jgi:predicted phosphodiesterase
VSTVLIIGDTHCPAMRKGYVSFLQKVADRYSPNRIVHIGDAADWHSISYHERIPALSSAGEEYHHAKRQIQQLVKAFPKADWMIGNHDALTERQARTAGLPPEVMLDYNDLWEVPWKVHPQFSELIIDDVVYTHGEGPGGMYAHGNAAKLRFRSVVMGHLHSNAGVIWHANTESRVFGLAVGCGVDNDKLQFLYGKKMPRKPILGCGVVINGKQAYFEPWLLPSR